MLVWQMSPGSRDLKLVSGFILQTDSVPRSMRLSKARGDAEIGGMLHLRTFALIVCAQAFCAGNATVICHASLRLTGPEDKHGVENTGGKISGRVYSFGPSVTPIFLIMNHLLYLLSTKYDKMKKISP